MEWELNPDCSNYSSSKCLVRFHISWISIIASSYREQVERVNRLKDETVRAVIKNSSDIAQFKVEVASRLRELRECAEIS